MRYLSEEERARLLAVCQASSDPRLYALVVVALGTGARQGELLSLRWRDVDIQRSVSILQKTKNGERRTLVLAGQVLNVLRDLSALRRIDTDELFAGVLGPATFPRATGIRSRSARRARQLVLRGVSEVDLARADLSSENPPASQERTTPCGSL